MLGDEHTDVKVASLEPVAKYIINTNGTSISQFIPALKNLSSENKWRVRLQLLKCISDISLNLGVLLLKRIMIFFLSNWKFFISIL